MDQLEYLIEINPVIVCGKHTLPKILNTGAYLTGCLYIYKDGGLMNVFAFSKCQKRGQICVCQVCCRSGGQFLEKFCNNKKKKRRLVLEEIY